MILECDLGNTLCKWRVVGGKERLGGSSACNYEALESSLPEIDVERIKVASVAATDRNEIIERFLTLKYGRKVEWAVSEASCAGVTCGYSEPASLGVDRWLAVLAAFNLKKNNVVVVDVGSALTVDLVSKEGCHLGGYIIPGDRLMWTALLKDTGKVRFNINELKPSLKFGLDTSSAVSAGIHAALLGAIMVAVNGAKENLNGVFDVIITGGGAESIANDLPINSEVCPELVLDGLQWALP